MDRRYQIFVSSTYNDLKDERHAALMSLLAMDAIPAGMELFPAADEDVWNAITQVIDQCDAYIVILGGRYGSLRSDGLSFTEAEYRYAVDKGKPVLAFLHKDPDGLQSEKRDEHPASTEKLRSFYERAKGKPCGYWETAGELASQLVISLVNLRKRPDLIGWVRADQLGEGDANEIVGLRRKVDELQAKIDSLATIPPVGSEQLAQGEEEFSVQYTVEVVTPSEFGARTTEHACARKMTWNAIVRVIAPLMMTPKSEYELRVALNAELNGRLRTAARDHRRATISDPSFHQIKVQLRALGLIQTADYRRSKEDTAIYWALTLYGDRYFMSLMAIRRDIQPAE